MKIKKLAFALSALALAALLSACGGDEKPTTEKGTLPFYTQGQTDAPTGDVGETPALEGALVYTTLDDGTCSVSWNGPFEGTEIVIPSSYEGKTVTAIADNGFYMLDTLTSVTLPDTLKTIGNQAFYGCGLADITIPASVTELGWNVFASCEKLATVNYTGTLAAMGAHVFEDTPFLASKTEDEFIFGSALVYVKNASGAYTVKDSVACIADAAFAGCEELTSVALPSSIKAIGNYVFDGCTALETVTAQGAIETIGRRAFNKCAALSSIEIKNGLTYIGEGAFYGCSSITAIALPDSVTEIGAWAFYNCVNLSQLTLGADSSLTILGDAAFSGCTALRQCALPAAVSTIGYATFRDCSNLESLVVPAAVTMIGDEAFANCTSLASLTFAEGSLLRSIGNNAFYNCAIITELKFPKSLVSIGESALKSCNSLVTIEVPFIGASVDSAKNADATALFGYIFGYSVAPSATAVQQNYSQNGAIYAYIPTTLKNVSVTGDVEIPYGAFSNCASIENLTISPNTTAIGANAFMNCSSLKSLELPDSLTVLPSAIFRGCSSITSIDLPAYLTEISADAFNGCSSLFDIELPATLVEIGVYAFNGCASLPSITLPATLTVISNHMLAGCASLKEVTLPATLQTIDIAAFSGCSSLEEVIIPDGTTTINQQAFSGCSSVKTVTIGKAVVTIGNAAFENCTSLKTVNFNAIECTQFGPLMPTTSEQKNFYKFPNIVKDLAFAGCAALDTIVFGEGVTRVPDHAFANCPALANVVIPASVATIGPAAFRDCPLLSNLVLSDALANIPESAFEACTALKTVTITKNVNSISARAFFGCTALEEIIFAPDGMLASIGDECFRNCGALKEINFPATLGAIGQRSFQDCITLTKVEFPDALTEVTNYSFVGCENISSVKLSPKTTIIGIDVFAESKITRIEIPYTVTHIRASAFEKCSLLSEVVFLTGEEYLPVIDEATGEPKRDENGEIIYETELTTMTSQLVSILDKAFAQTAIVEFTFPKGVKDIPGGVLDKCPELRRVYFENGSVAVSMAANAFRECHKLEEFVFPQYMTKVKANVFNKIKNTIKLYIFHEPDVFTEIITGTEYTSNGNDTVKNATWYVYSETEPTAEGNYWHYDANGKPVEW